MKSAIYIRCSNEARDRQTLKVQEEKCSEWASNRDRDLYPKIFTDDGWSGAERNRPDFQEMLGLVRRGEIGEIIVYRLDRFSRSLLHAVDIMEDLKEYGCNLVSWHDQIDFGTPQGKLHFRVLVMFAEYERESIAERTRDAKKRVMRQGRLPHGKPPFGYTNSPDGIAVNQSQAEVVKKIFRWYMDGKKLEEISRLSSVAKSTVERILKNDVYWTGKYHMRIGDETQRVRVPPIISRKLFERVRSMRKSKGTMTRESGYPFLLKGKIYCVKCGSNLYGREMDPYVYYQHQCDGGWVNLKAEEIEEKIKNKVDEMFENPKAIMREIEKKRKEMDRNRAKWREKIVKTEAEMAKLEGDRERIIDDLAPATSGDMRQALLKRGEDISNQIKRLERILAEYEDKLKEAELPATLVSDREVINGILRKKGIDRMFPPRSIEYNPDTGELVCHYPIEFSLKSQDR